MRYFHTGGIVTLTLLLAGCGQASNGPASPDRHGRYAGIGTYPADQLWSHMAEPARPADAAAATISDDEQIIVLVDSHSGEVRQCGNLSGHCIAMNPWTGATRAAPVRLTAHAADLAREAEESSGAGPPDNATAPAKANIR